MLVISVFLIEAPWNPVWPGNIRGAHDKVRARVIIMVREGLAETDIVFHDVHCCTCCKHKQCAASDATICHDTGRDGCVLVPCDLQGYENQRKHSEKYYEQDDPPATPGVQGAAPLQEQ